MPIFSVSDRKSNSSESKTMANKKLVWRTQVGMTSEGPFKVFYFVGGTSIKIHSVA